MDFILETKISHVKELREEVQYYKKLVEDIKATYLAQNRDTFSLLELKEDTLREAERALKEEALQRYRNDPEKKKKVYEFLQEKDITSFKYAEEDALAWAQEHKLYVSLDKKGFESYLRSLKGKGLPSFVKQEVKETITIAQEL